MANTNFETEAIKQYNETKYIDVVKLANNNGIQVYDTNEVTDAKILLENGKYIILVNMLCPSKERIRFSVAHELAHYQLDKDSITEEGLNRTPKNDISDQETKTIERNADKLAAKILIPDEIIQNEIENSNLNIEPANKNYIVELAKKFEVSKKMMAIRLTEMGVVIQDYSF